MQKQQRHMTYGLPYKGSKTKLAERIIIPRTQEYVKDNGLFGKIII